MGDHNNQDTTLTNLFAQEHDTGITRPSLAFWNRPDARRDAEMIAYQTILQNKESLQQQGFSKPAAAVYLNDRANYAFTLYDADKQTPQDVAPAGKTVIVKIDPLNL